VATDRTTMQQAGSRAAARRTLLLTRARTADRLAESRSGDQTPG
jgi:hypothetical protein